MAESPSEKVLKGICRLDATDPRENMILCGCIFFARIRDELGGVLHMQFGKDTIPVRLDQNVPDRAAWVCYNGQILSVNIDE